MIVAAGGPPGRYHRGMDAGAVAASNLASFRELARASPGALLLEEEGVAAVVTPSSPERPLLNSMFVAPGASLATGYDRLQAAYRGHGVEAITCWIDPDDRASRELLRDRGHVHDGSPRLMAAPIDAIAAQPDPALPVAAAPSVADVAWLNDQVYGLPGSVARSLGAGDGEGLLLAVARGGDLPAACAIVVVVGGDAHVTLVATLPAHRGRGLARSLIWQLLAAAAARGCTTTSLVATAAGAPVYLGLGYRDLGHLEMWERKLG